MPGHIRKRGRRKDGSTRWQARYTDPTAHPASTLKIERTFPTRQEAERWLHQQQAAITSGTHIHPTAASRRFAEVTTAWQESWPNRLQPNTARRYTGILNNYLLPEFSDTALSQITHERVQRYINRLSTGEVAPGTVRNVYAVLRSALAQAVRLGIIPSNPCTDIDLPRANRQEMLFLTAAQVRQLAEAIDPHYRVLIYTAAYTGLRAGELGGLTRADVDLLRGVLHVSRALKDVNGKLELGPTKTHANRTVSLPGFLRILLQEHLASQSPAPGGHLFTMKKGQPLRHGLVYGRYFKAAVRQALPPELAGLRFHDLRHTCAALSIAAGAHPKLISARLGHSSIQITLDRYGHLFPSVEEALAEQLDAAFAAGQQSEPATSNVVLLR
jgi:integrase